LVFINKIRHAEEAPTEDTYSKEELKKFMQKMGKRFLNLELFDEIHLVLPASMHPDILADSAANFAALPVNKLIISKIDETSRLGNILNVGKRIDLPISFFTNGQRVPDDIFLADKNKIANMIIN